MKFPRYWAKEESEERTLDGRRVPFAVWQWSESGLDEARSRARDAARRIAERIRRGDPFPDRYAYGDRPVREEIIREHRTAAGTLSLVMSRNVYGTLVLNSDRVMFIDVDLPRRGLGERLVRWLRSRFGLGDPPPAPLEEALLRLREWVEARPGWGVRAYRTRAGLRYLVTHEVFDPTGTEAHRTMETLGSDPRYQALCRVQECFRARLTPKPWRCGTRPPGVRFPFEDAVAEKAMTTWAEEYDTAREAWDTCAFLEWVGGEAVHPEVRAVLEIHDRMTGVGRGRPLA